MADLLHITRAEFFKLIKRPFIWYALVVLLVLLGVNFNAKINNALLPPEEITPLSPDPESYTRQVAFPDVFDQAAINVHLPAFILLILINVTICQEFQWGAMRTLLCRMPGRGRQVGARFFAFAWLAAVYLLIMWIFYSIMGVWAA
ncbi:MAG: hypothetical protein JXA42_11250, partial [Anaerolineales bacterium]|nr:hypothetical protein [Anaerolineales bacterium]